VRVTGRDIRLSAEPGLGPSVRVGCGATVYELSPGATVEFRASAAEPDAPAAPGDALPAQVT